MFCIFAIPHPELIWNMDNSKILTHELRVIPTGKIHESFYRVGEKLNFTRAEIGPTANASITKK